MIVGVRIAGRKRRGVGGGVARVDVSEVRWVEKKKSTLYGGANFDVFDFIRGMRTSVDRTDSVGQLFDQVY